VNKAVAKSEEGKAAETSVDSQQPPAKVSEYPRPGAIECPKCHRQRCPATGGTQNLKAGRTRYRKCGDCGWVFSTIQRWIGGGKLGPEVVDI